MANRSDMHAALPRYLKRIWMSGKWENEHEAGSIKRLMIESHANYRDYKNKKRTMDTSDSNDE